MRLPTLLGHPPRLPRTVFHMHRRHWWASSATVDAASDSQIWPLLHNLDLDTSQFPLHRSKRRWVVFSDLHCKSSTLEPCLEVLDLVRDTCRARNAGAIFLGDFWDVRYVFRVQILNQVMTALHTWNDIPVVMIPGNHDMVDKPGRSHALSVLEYALPSADQILVADRPTRFLDALWLPYMPTAELDQWLQPFRDPVSPGVGCCFMHAEIKGSFVGENVQWMRGIDSQGLRDGLRVYSGHFHNPQKVSERVFYVGSPYEVTAAEAGQQKSLLVLDRDMGWAVQEKEEICIGPRHFKVASMQEMEALPRLAPGDRVVVTRSIPELNGNEFGHERFEDVVQDIRNEGAFVKVQDWELPTSLMNTESSGVDRTPAELLMSYVDGLAEDGSISPEMAHRLVDRGKVLLSSALESVREGAAAVSHLEFGEISLEGFGPFEQKQSYSLSNRGLVLVRGSFEDDETLSNGTGKTTLGFAALWALSGQIDGRPIPGGDVTSVVNHLSGECTVSLSGTTNGSPFEIVRRRQLTKGRKTRHVSLEFSVDGVDHTMQSVVETQKVIEERLGTTSQLLAKTVFHGQHQLAGLLATSDTDLRREISLITAHDHWNHAAKAAKGKRQMVDSASASLQGQLKVHGENLDRMRNQELHLVEQLKQYRDLDATEETCDPFVLIGQLKQDVAAAHERIAEFEKQRLNAQNNTLLAELSGALQGLQVDRQKHVEEKKQNQFELNHIERSISTLSERVLSAEQSIARFTYEVEEIAFCPACKQSLSDLSEVGQLSLQQTLAELEKEQFQAEADIENLLNKKSRLNEASSKVDASLEALQVEIDMVNNKHTRLSEDVRVEVSKIQEEMQKSRQVYNGFADKLESLSRAQEERIRLRESIRHNEASAKQLQAEIVSTEKRIAKDKAELERLHEDQAVYRFLERAFEKELQSAELRNTLAMLSNFTQKYLDMLSRGQLRLVLDLEGDRIVRNVFIALNDGRHVPLSLASLSGGQWRRCALAFSLAFTELAAYAGKLRSSLLVFDEPMIHLDNDGRQGVGRVLRHLLAKRDVNTILVILQDYVELETEFDETDNVSRLSDGSSVITPIDVDGFSDGSF